MKLDVSLEEILVIGSVLCALLIALGITFGEVPIVEGGAIIVSLCGGTVLAEVLGIMRQDACMHTTENG